MSDDLKDYPRAGVTLGEADLVEIEITWSPMWTVVLSFTVKLDSPQDRAMRERGVGASATLNFEEGSSKGPLRVGRRIVKGDKVEYDIEAPEGKELDALRLVARA